MLYRIFQRLIAALLYLVPAASVVLVQSSYFMFPTPESWNFWMPVLGPTGLLFWLRRQPQLMPIALVFVLGLIQDVMFGGLLGVSSLIYLGVTWLFSLANAQLTRISLPAFYILSLFLLLFMFFLEWSFYAVLYFVDFPLKMAWRVALVTWLFSPLVYIVLRFVEKLAVPGQFEIE